MKLYRHLLASYLLVCLIPFLLSLFTTLRLEQNIQNTILSDKESIAENIRWEIDQKLESAIRTAGILANDSTILSLTNVYTFSDAQSISQQDVIKLLNQTVEQQQSLTHTFVYFFRSGRLISNLRGYSEPIVDTYAKSLSIPYSVFNSLLQSSNDLYAVQPVMDTHGTPYLLVTYNLFSGDYRSKLACIGFLLRIPQNLVQWDDENSEVFLVQDGVKIYGSSLATQAIRQLSGNLQSSRLTLEGESYICSLQKSTQCTIYYGLLTKQSEYYASVRLLQQQIIFEIAIYILFSILAAVFFSRRTWSPFQKIINFVGSRRKEEAGFESFDSVQRAIQSLAEEKDLLENRLLQSHQQNCARYISRYLLGFSSDSSTLSQYIEDGQPYRLLLFSLIKPEGSEFFANVPQNRYAETLEMLYFAVRNILEEILLENRNGVSVMVEDCVVLAVQDTPSLGIPEEIALAVHTAEQALSLSIACYISPVCYHLSEGPVAWNQVQGLYRETGFWQKERQPGIWQVPLSEDSYAEDGYPGRIRALSLHLAEQNIPQAKADFEEILRHDLQGQPAKLIRYRLIGMTELLAAYLPGSEDYLQKVMTPGPAEEKRQLLQEQFEKICAVCAPENEGSEVVPSPDKNAQWAVTVRQYIQDNYENPSLNASMIADHLGLSLSTLSRRYKSAAGHGVLDEIHLTRIQKAKELLQRGMTVRAAAEQTGYIESRAMIRAFKRYEGITPGQYVGKE